MGLTGSSQSISNPAARLREGTNPNRYTILLSMTAVIFTEMHLDI